MIPAEIEFMANVVGPPPGTVELAADMLTTAADALADLRSDLTHGEARVLLGILVSDWPSKPKAEFVDATAAWASDQAKVRASRATEEGGELQRHLADQIAGRYRCEPWPWPMLTSLSRSLLPGSVTIVCGTPGSAKSWFVLSCLRWWTAHGINAAVLMLEETRKWHLNRALAQCQGDANILNPDWCRLNRDAAMQSYERHHDEIDRIRDRLTCDGDKTVAQCAEWVESQCDAGARVIVIDPITLADSGGEKPWDADRKFMGRVKTAINKSGSSLVLVTHPRKQSGGGKSVAPAGLDDLAGGAAYGRACASALWLTGAGDGVMMPVVDSHGAYAEHQVHKVMRVIKARNSVGCGKSLAYQFRDLSFDELGQIVQKSEPEHKPSRRGEKLRAKPSQDEDHFA
jgi:hypothetical protein